MSPLICEPFLWRRKWTFLRHLLLPWQSTIRLLCGWEPCSLSILGGSETTRKPFQKKWLPLLGGWLLLSICLLPWKFNLLAATAGLAIGFYKIPGKSTCTIWKSGNRKFFSNCLQVIAIKLLSKPSQTHYALALGPKSIHINTNTHTYYLLP